MPPIDSRSLTRGPEPYESVADMRASYAQRVGSRLAAQGPLNAGQPLHAPNQVRPFLPMPSVPEQIGIDRSVWATYSPALRHALLTAKLPDLSPDGITAVIVQFDMCAPNRGFVPPDFAPGVPGVPGPGVPGPGVPGIPGGPPPTTDFPGAPGGPSGDIPGVQGGPTGQTVGVQPPMAPPMTQQAFAAPGGAPYQGIQYSPYGQIQPAGQAQPPGFPPLLGWVILGGSLLATAWMLWEVTRLRSELQHGRR